MKAERILRIFPKSHTIAKVKFGADSSRLYSADASGGSCSVWELPSGKRLHRYIHHENTFIISLAVGTNLLCTGSQHGEITIWDIHSGKILNSLTDPERMIFDLQLTKNEDYLLSTGIKPDALWKLDSEKQPYLVRNFQSAQLSYDDKHLIQALGDRIIFEPLDPSAKPYAILGEYDEVYEVTQSPNGQYLALMNRIDRVMLIQAGTSESFTFDDTWRYDIKNLEFSPDSKFIFGLNTDAYVYVWNVETHEQVLHFGFDFVTKFFSFTSIALSPDGKYIACAGRNVQHMSVIEIWELS